MFLLGHSSYLPTVNNKNFQALNGIQKLEWGDTIRVQSEETEYLYRVQKVYEVKASAASADIEWGKAKIILVTCNSFGSKDDRFVVEGYLIKSYPIGKPGTAE
jgi:LPXTG-site transpeptidase (sortase) family protein